MWDCKTSKTSQSPRAALNAFGLFAAGGHDDRHCESAVTADGGSPASRHFRRRDRTEKCGTQAANPEDATLILACFMRLDAAISGYPIEPYKAHLRTKISEAPKAAWYRKAFRVDSPVSEDRWCNVGVMLYRQNEMLAEYVHPGFQTMVASRVVTSRTEYPRG